MKISIHTTITNPEENQYPYLEAIQSYCALADEVIVVDGGSTDDSLEKIRMIDPKVKIVTLPWPQDTWNWWELPKHLNYGLDRCTGDWCVKMDIDYVIHENEIPKIHERLNAAFMIKELGVASFLKKVVLNKDFSFDKSIIPFAIKGYWRDRIRYGKATNRNTDWCYPVYAKQDEEKPEGIAIETYLNTGCRIHCYDYYFRTKDKARAIFWKFAKAYGEGTDNWAWGETEEKSFEVLTGMFRGRLRKHRKEPDHPKFIRDRALSVNPEQMGFDNWGMYKP